ncbi:MAG TPA: ornithine carbamoyltransferase [Candidatus Baltobacteraceae bacterium]|nr:ornithine carbamoyltransferase [Candidatus Baltobacteraceae bacterium]
MNRHLITLTDLSAQDVLDLFALAADLKAKRRQGIAHPLLAGKTLALVFEKPSLRTRVTFETGMTQLGGHAIYLTPSDIQLGERETVQDAARNLERWVDGIVARTFSHQMVERLAGFAQIPVINGLTDGHHPVQILCDLFTLWERRGKLAGLRVVFVGDGNNVCHSWLQGAAKMGIHFVLACPPGYEPHGAILAEALAEAKGTGATLTIAHDPKAAARSADVLYTDVWTSMGQEEERSRRLRDFQGFQLNQELLDRAAPEVLVMHCLPAHRGEEITDEVLDGAHSIVFDQAENRLHVQKAILVRLLGA